MDASVAVKKPADKFIGNKPGGFEEKTIPSHLRNYSGKRIQAFAKNIPHVKDPSNVCLRKAYDPELSKQLDAAKQSIPTLSKEVISKNARDEAMLLAAKAAELVLQGVKILPGVPHLFVAAFLAKVIGSNLKNSGKLAWNEQRVLAGGKNR